MCPSDSYGPWCGAPAAPLSRGAWCDPLAGTGSEQDPLLLKNAFRMTLIFNLNFIAFALRNVDFELQTFQSQSFGFGVIFEHPWFAFCDDILQQVCFSFKAFEDVLTGAQPGGAAVPWSPSLVLNKIMPKANNCLKICW